MANGTAVVGAQKDDTQENNQGAVHLFELASSGSLTPALDGSGTLTLTDTAGSDDDLTLMLTGGGADLQITSASEPFDSTPAAGTLSNGNLTLTLPLASVNSLVIDSLAGDDHLTLDYSGGNFTLPISYHGGSQATTDGDSLTLTGGTHTTTTYNFTGADSAGAGTGFDGNLDFDGQLITFTGLEPITNSGTAEDVVFNLPNLPNPDATLRNNATGGFNELVGSSFENATFANPTGTTPSLTINGGTDTDTIFVEGLDGSFDADLSVLASDAADSVTFQTNPTTIGSHDLLVDTGTIDSSVQLTADNLDFTATALTSSGGLNASGILSVEIADPSTISGVISSTALVRKLGSGTLSITTQATSNGGVEVNQGTLQLNAGVGFDMGVFTGGQTLSVASGAILETASDWNISSFNLIDLDGTLSITSGIAADGLVYINNIDATGGSVVGNPFRVGNSSNGSFTLAGGAEIASDIYLVNDVNVTGIRNLTVTVPASNSGIMSGMIRELGQNGTTPFRLGTDLIKSGAGTLSLGVANTYSGDTIVSQGVLEIDHPDALGSSTVTLNDTNTGTTDASLLATFANLGNSIGNNIVVANEGSGTAAIGTTPFNVGGVPTLFDGMLTLNRQTTLVGGNADRTTYRGVITGPVGTLTVNGGNRTTWEAVNTFVGDVDLTDSGSVLQVGTGGNHIPDSSSLTVGAGTTFQLNNTSETIDALNGSGTVQNIIGGNTLTVGASGGSGSFSGVLTNGSGALSLTKTGAGTQSLSGGNNPATGLLRVEGGQLNVGGGFGSEGAWAGNVTITGGELQLNQSNIFNNGSDFTINAPGQLDFNGQSDFIGNLQGDGNIVGNTNGQGIFLDDLNTTHTFTGDISGGGGLRVRGSLANGGTQVFSGGTIDLGALAIGRGEVSITGGADVSVSGTAVVGTNRTGNVGGIAGGNATGILNIDSGSLDFNHMEIGNRVSGTVVGTVNHSGGIVTALGSSAPDNSGIRIGHWPDTDATYNLSGLGILNINNNRDLGIAIDGTGQFVQTGGLLNTRRINVNTRNANGDGTFTQTGGLANIGAGGIVSTGGSTAVNLGGGTLRATADWSSTLVMTLTAAVGDQTIDTNTFNINLTGGLSGNGGLDKIGNGTLTLAAANTYTGTTSVTGGTLSVTGEIGNGGPAGLVSVSGTASLVGSGIVNAEVTSAGMVAPGVGAPTATLATGNTDFTAGSFAVDLNGTTAGTDYDQLNVTGSVNLSGSPALNLSLGFTPTPGDLFTIIENDDTDLVTGTFAGLDEGEVFTRAGEMFQITYQGGTGNDVVLRAFDNTFDGTPDGDDFLVTDDGTLIHLSLDGSEIFSGPRNTSLVINGLAGDDSLTIDNTSSTQVIADITFNGEGDDDSLSVLDGTATDLIYTPHAGSGDTARGSIELDGQTITFTGLEPTLVTTTATNVTIDLSSLVAAETVTLSDDGGAANNMSRVSFLSNTLEDIDFTNPTALLRVIANTNATVDTLNVEGLDSSFDADLTLDGASVDPITFQTTTTNLDTGNLSATGGSIAISADVTTTGNATLNATGTIVSGTGTLSAGDLTADAIGGIQLNTTVATIDASVSAAGSIEIVETDMVTLTDVDTVDGDIDVAAGGSLTATDVVAGGAGDILLSTDPGSGADLLVNSVTADGNTMTITADGAIEEDSLDAGVDLTATNINLTADTGIGNLDSIEIDADDGLFEGLAATNNTSGDIQLADPDELRILTASTFGDNTTLDTGGNATIDGTVDAFVNVNVTSQAALVIELGGFLSTISGDVNLSALGGSLTQNAFSSILSGAAINMNSSDSTFVGGGNTSDTTFTSTATNDTTVTTNGSISSAGTASISTTNGMIEVLGTGSVSSSGGDVILDAGSSVLIEGSVNASGFGNFSLDIDAVTTVEVTMFASVDASTDLTIDSGGNQLISGSVGFFVSDIQLNSGAALSITDTASVSASSSVITISVTDTTVSGGSVTATGGFLVNMSAGGNLTVDAGGFIDSGVDLMIAADGDLTLASGTSATANGLASLSGGQSGAGATLAIGGTVSGNTITINGGAGADTIIIDDNDGTLGDGGTVENLQNDATINAGGGSDSLQLDDSGSVDSDTIDVNQGQNEQIIGLHESFTISYDDLESVELFASVAEDIINVQLSPATAFTMHGNDPTVADPAPGDTLNILTSDNTLTLPFVFAATTDGTLTDSPDQTLIWTSIESFTIDGEAFVVNDLFVLTGNNADRIIFFSTNGTDTEVRIGNTTYGPFAIPATNRMVAYSQGGNDQIIVHGLLPPIAEFHGGAGNDYITGSTGNDFLFGGLGNDIILGGEGHNFIHGDDPLDPTVGGTDRLEGRSGDDTIIGGAGSDRIIGNAGEDTLDGGQGIDQLFGGLGNDFSFGGGAGDGTPDAGFDLIRDEIGDDVILGGAGQDILFGDRDNDLVIGGTGGDRINGGSSDDLLVNGSSALESAIDLAMTQIAANAGSRPVMPNTLFNTNVLPALTMWRTSNSAAGFGPFTDDTGIELTDIDDMTGGTGTDIFDAALNDLLRDVRSSESDTVI